MNINKSSALEELVDCKSGGASYSECGGESVGSRAEMCNGAEIFKAVALFLERVIRGGFAFDNNFGCMHLKRLFCVRSKNDIADYGNGGANVELIDLLEIINFIFLISKLFRKILVNFSHFSNKSLLMTCNASCPYGIK